MERITVAPDAIGATEEVGLARVTYPFTLIMSQDCDLEWDHTAREQFLALGEPPVAGQARRDWNEATKSARTKLMDSVLMCVADEVVVVRDSSALTTKLWQFAESNQHERYHFLRPGGPDVDLQGEGFPNLVLDFKRYLSVPADELRVRTALEGNAVGRTRRRAVLQSPFLEDVASRFFRFQSRIALPDEQRAP